MVRRRRAGTPKSRRQSGRRHPSELPETCPGVRVYSGAPIDTLARFVAREAATQTIHSYENRWPLKHLNESVQEVLQVMVSRFEIFLENPLSFGNGLDGQCVITHEDPLARD